MSTALRGTMLTPGVSKNGRLYTPELIQKAHARLTERLASGRPVTMLTHHAAGDDSRLIVGRVTAVEMNGQNLDYTAALADTAAAEDIAALVDDKRGEGPFLENVSIRGWWVGDVQTVDGCETADDLEIDGLDFTKSPGVDGATVRLADSSAKESTDGRVLITESVEAHVFTETTTEEVTEADKEPYGKVAYADPGYQKDKKKRYPVNTKDRAKAAWSYINQKDNADLYTAAQLKRIKGRIKAALKKFGVTVTAESLAVIATITPEVHMLNESDTTLSDVAECYDSTGTAGFSISAYNGPLTVSISAYNGVEAADLSGVAMAAMKAACDAIHALDPDDDGDIDTGAISDETDDNQMEAAPVAATVKEADVAETTEAGQAAENTEEPTPTEGSVTEESTESTDESEDATLTRADLEAAVATAVAAALAANTPAESTEDAPVTETEAGQAAEADASALRESIRAEVIREAVKNGVITRKGLVETSGAEPEKPLHEMNDEEFRAYQEQRSHLFFAHNPQ